MSRLTIGGLLLAACLAAACSGPSKSDSGGEASTPKTARRPKAPETIPNPVAQFSLVAASGSVVPGTRTWLGARFVIADGWHVYGKDPGDAGMPTRVNIEATPGVTVGDAQYPPAKRFVDEGDIVTHGYEREVVLLIPVDAPADLAPGTELTFRASGSWLACKDQCIRETAEAVLVMKAGDALAPPAESAAVFARFPIPPTESIATP